jgi:DNA helicase HerA-like ATPase
MNRKESFVKEIEAAYKFEGPSIVLGGAMFENECITGLHVSLPLKTLNRHGLISGATGTGKTKSLQIMAEQLSINSIPVLVMDVKGDLSGIAKSSDGHPKIEERHQKIGLPFVRDNSPVEFLSLSDEKGIRLRATVSEFGPILFSKILDLNDIQQSIVAVIFKYCDDHALPLLDLEDFKKTLQYFTGEGKSSLEKEYGRISTASMATIMRKIVELEQQDADIFFGERSFDVKDLVRFNEDGKGIVSIVRLTDIQDKPSLFSTFMLQLLAEIYTTFPEEGDLDKPKLVLFIDEAHLIFEKASDALLDQIEAIIKLIRSKGVGIFFVTQNPVDIPDQVLAQLGLKIQHALRAFTAKDRKAIKLAAENFPITDYYDIDNAIMELGIGESLVTVLDEKGRPTPLARVMMRAPQSRMDVLTPGEINYIVRGSSLIEKYNEQIDRESAYEILSEKIQLAQEKQRQDELQKQREEAKRSVRLKTRRSYTRKSTLEKAIDNTARSLGRTLARELTRGILGILGGRK